MPSFSWFENLQKDRRDYLEVAARNKFESGVWQSTVEKYPDPTHFVYELLQNAEDQGATSAEFDLLPKGLRFRHNGSPFSAADVESITGWGNSNKPDLENKIGRFGIGFKSVFMITKKPRIFTFIEGQPFAFAIEDLFLPIAQPEDLEQCEEGWTKFWLPFWPAKAPQLHAKIREKLERLGAKTLLFLRHLESVKWKCDTQNGEFICERKGNCCTLLGRGPRGEEWQQYRLFTRTVADAGVDVDANRDLTIKIAFRLDDTGKIVVPEAQNTSVHVYFPTEQPFPARFLIHAPFLLADNRANLKQDEPFNIHLVHELADLVAKALPELRDEDRWSVESLAALPISTPTNTVYREWLPIYNSVVTAFKQEKLLPTFDRSFARPFESRLARSAELRELFSPLQLGALYDARHPIFWLHEEISSDRAATQDIHRFINATLEVSALEGDAIAPRLTGDFLVRQNDEWMLAFYRFLSRQEALWRQSTRGRLRYEGIIRTADAKQVAPFDRNEIAQVFLQPNANGSAPGQIVAPQFLKNEEAFDFFKRLGLREPDVRDEVLNEVLPRYSEESEIPDDIQYSQDLALIASALVTHSSHAVLLDAVCDAYIVRVVNAMSGDDAWVIPEANLVYTRTPDLEVWFNQEEQAWFIEESLENNLDWQRIQATLRAARHSIAPDVLSVSFRKSRPDGYVILRDNYGDHQRGLNGFDPNAEIPGLAGNLSHPTERTSHLLWNLLRQHPQLIRGEVESSSYKNFDRKCVVEEQWSIFGQECAQSAWLPHPTRTGEWCKPCDLELADLPHDWDTTSAAARSVALKLGFKRSELQETAEKLGLSAADLDFFQQNKEFIGEFRQLVAQRKRVEFPEKPVPDPTRRMAKLEQELKDAPIRAYEAKSRSVRVSEFSRDEKREYLRSSYTNLDGELICQMCEEPMPFKLHDGKHYFEAVTCLPTLTRESKENYLALCPVCAAKYQNALDEEAEDLAVLMAEADEDAREIGVTVVGELHKIRFVESHWLDLKTIFAAHKKA